MIQSPTVQCGSTALAARENQVVNQFNQLAKSVDEISNLSRDISARLSPILRAEPETEKDPQINKMPPEEYLVPLADQIRNVRRQLSDAGSTLRSVLQRSEI